MKDTEARTRIDSIEEIIDKYKNELEPLSVQYCKKCGHDALFHKEVIGYIKGANEFRCVYRHFAYRCLTCGTLWKDTTEMKEVESE